MTTEQATQILQMFYDYDRLAGAEFDRKYGFGWAVRLREEYVFNRADRDNLSVGYLTEQVRHLDEAMMLCWLAREALATTGAVQR